ncbi:amino acid ABC transporter permease [Microbacterium horticulturae]|uniref:Amino acid ABC transporter permease n=1 Tax=Microbacterium horticulturae TaxID=3028316 RepID=A0ABY8BU38_9MICO|nr:amino acid ABC transporter permease [Microbacterium sp. KACC 23027]WEG07688.1 amino acid ABC transporter permease [Microbacterium sp. KACC 23027]
MDEVGHLWWQAIEGTLVLFFAGGVIALVLGFIVGAMRVSPVPIARAVGTVYVNWIRNTPLTLVMFFFAFCIPILLGQRINAIMLATIALGVYTATYIAETIRSGVNTVPVGQAEAARALGLGFGQVMSLVILPQAFRSVVPPMMSVLIALLKNTTVAAGFSVLNLGSVTAYLSEHRTASADNIFQAMVTGENQLLTLLLIAVIFVVLVLLLAWLQRVLERKWKVER